VLEVDDDEVLPLPKATAAVTMPPSTSRIPRPTPDEPREGRDEVVTGDGAAGGDAFARVEYEIPVPGIPTVVRTPRLDRFTVAPRFPALTETPRFPMLSRNPGINFTERRTRQPMDPA